jgi:predicted site-specific integrase-resolvase
VSTRKQIEDLQRQADFLHLKYPEAEVVKDIGSGLSFKRKGLQALLERALRGESLTVVVTYRDRLSRFGFDLIEQLVKRSGGSIVVLNQVSTSPVEELTRDLTAIITVFGSRIHGLRSHKSKKALAQAITRAETSLP